MLLQNIYQFSFTTLFGQLILILYYLTGSNKYWTGGNDFAVQGVYRWAGVDTLLIPTSTNWGWSHEGANSATERCVAIVPSGTFDYKWIDLICSRPARFICEQL